ncbi:hypothetical protein BGW38_003032 [Lunasporangiospora selenospora]|uniref:2Fe-2S ferredoxin-type domain-containing protein n=1 Tax=Lunasporangiospora selenospora TaxID=979761 RepID=A0A9P6KCH8_9FUNG|nr:hypothetical protein BGW38_003032 [Lunasporangiospora selenospora]
MASIATAFRPTWTSVGRSIIANRSLALTGSTSGGFALSTPSFAAAQMARAQGLKRSTGAPAWLCSFQTSAFSTASGPVFAKRGRPGPDQGFAVNFVLQDGEEISVRAFEGESLLDVAWANDIDIEGACDASLACSTCHLILDEGSYNKLEEPTDEENDMLDLAFGLSDT